MAKFTIESIVELELRVKTSDGDTSIRKHRFAEDAAQHYTEETFICWLQKIRWNEPKPIPVLKKGHWILEPIVTVECNTVWRHRYAYRDRLFRRTLKVFQHYLPLK